MKRLRALGGWCSLGIAVAAIGGGALVGKRYLEINMLSGVLGPGVEAQAVKLHWMHSAGCAEKVTIPLPNTTDSSERSVQLFAPKLWFTFDAAALMQKRFILPRVLIEDAVIAADPTAVENIDVVDVEFGPAVEVGELVEQSTGQTANQSTTGSLPSSSSTSVAVTQDSMPSPEAQQTVVASSKAVPWLDEFSTLRDSLSSFEYAQGRQVSIDADMVFERLQSFFDNKRQLSQRLISEARDLQQQVLAMDNVLRNGPELNEYMRRMEVTQDSLIKLKVEIGHVGKLLDEEQSRVRAALLVEKKQLIELSEQVPTPDARQLAKAYLDYALTQQLSQPKQVVMILSDLMRRPFRYAEPKRGQSLRSADIDSPEFAAESTEVNGQLEIAGRNWPFTAQGSFRVLPQTLDATSEKTVSNQSANPSTMHSRGSAKWHMALEREQGSWQLEGSSELQEIDSKIKLTSSAAEQMVLDCVVAGKQVSIDGSLELRAWLSDESAAKASADFAADYQSRALLEQLLTCMQAAIDTAPASMPFHIDSADDEVLPDQVTVDWLAEQLAQAAARGLTTSYTQASQNLDSLVAQKLNEQKGMVATLRRDAEQHVTTQIDEVRKLQAAVSSLIEQRQTGSYFARQPGEVAR